MNPGDPPQPDPRKLAGLARFNALPLNEAVAALRVCCGSERWAAAMGAARPFADAQSLMAEAAKIWFGLGPSDWLEAFAHHPRIGERDLASPKFATTADQARREQSGMALASDDVRREFVRLNAEYEQRFGHVFLICATGKSADEMLRQLKSRIGLDGPAELQNAAKEQNMITGLRLERMLAE